MKLVSHNLNGNIHAAAEWINRYALADYLIHMDCPRGERTIIVFRVPQDFDFKKHLDTMYELHRAAESRL